MKLEVKVCQHSVHSFILTTVVPTELQFGLQFHWCGHARAGLDAPNFHPVFLTLKPV